MADRETLSLLGPERRASVTDQLREAVVNILVTTHLGHWPEDIKRNIVTNYRGLTNDAEEMYAASNSFMDQADYGFSGNSLLSMLARRIAEAIGSADKPEVRLAALESAVPHVMALKLGPLIKKVARAQH